MTMRHRVGTNESWSGAARAVAIAAVLLFAGGPARAADFCACEGRASLGNFNTNDESNWAALGVTRNAACNGSVVFFPLPEDGVLVFDSFVVSNTQSNGCNTTLVFTRAATDTRNTPVTILVKGDATIAGGDVISVAGSTGGNGLDGAPGFGGLGGRGGFAGAEGAYQLVNFASNGGTGIGPGGGLGSLAVGRTLANGGTLFSVPELRPLSGGSGGGGGHSTSNSFTCSAGGGGGGGGALLLVANGTLSIDGTITANGGNGGQRLTPSCSSAGAGGSGGAIRLAATTILGGGSVAAAGGTAGCCSDAPANGGGAGRIRMEAITNSFAANNTNPVAVRAPSPGPIANPITPTVVITSVDGNVTEEFPKGFRGEVDLTVEAPGPIQVAFATQDVPAGTDLQLTVKPRVGAAPFSQNVTLAAGGCSAGACVATTTVDLTPGAYILEARATFQVP